MHTTWIFLGLLLTCILHVSTAGTASHRVRRSPIERISGYKRFEEKTPQGFHYRIGAITDLDQRSRIRGLGKWFAFLSTLDLYIRYTPEDAHHANISIKWEGRTPEVLETGVADSGRGQELSELILFKDRLLTCDDRTGIVYTVKNLAAIRALQAVCFLVGAIFVKASAGHEVNSVRKKATSGCS